jgi:hypothetical protein
VTHSNKTVTMNVPKDDLNPEQKVDECAKIIAYKSAERNGKLSFQVKETGVFRPEEINRDINQRVKKRIPKYEHEKKISGSPSIGNITSGDQEIKLWFTQRRSWLQRPLQVASLPATTRTS